MSPIIASLSEAANAPEEVDIRNTISGEVKVLTGRAEIELRLSDPQIPPDTTSQSPVWLASVVLFVGIVVFVAVAMKRLTRRPDVLQCSGHMKTHFLTTYGSVNVPSNEMYRQEIERRALVKCRIVSKVKTRPTKFDRVSKVWRAKQSKNRHRMDRIPEEPEDDRTTKFVHKLRAKCSELLKVR